jgi:hypothetical protein
LLSDEELARKLRDEEQAAGSSVAAPEPLPPQQPGDNELDAILDPPSQILREKLLRKKKELYAAQSDAEVTKAEKEIADLEVIIHSLCTF